MIWKEAINLDQLNNTPEYLGSFLGIQFTEWTADSITATMPVNKKTHQPWGVLHGGASVALAETIGSYASSLIVDLKRFKPVGLEINANHIRPVTDGIVKGIGTPIHIGRTTHIWDIKIYNEHNKIVCSSRLTVAIIEAS
ncbi:MAG: hotdog fold thioesterase [Flavobacteriales bacterium]|jgi:1,4-dihydroxy-2-naphthoyl-CoA hydrolase|nr:hotdog fold thioesterase [Flavobacteriales bacterium]